MSRPLLLDLFCGAGGAAMGYHRAGFDVVGVDIRPQPHYPFQFHQRDAMELLKNGGPLVCAQRGLLRFEAIVASPPCQAYSTTRTLHGKSYPDLVSKVREALKNMRLPYIIENVPGAPLQKQASFYTPEIGCIQLCGSAFGLGVWRHRLFEANVPLRGVACRHYLTPFPLDVTGTGGPGGRHRKPRSLAEARAALGIDWMKREELSEAIPPAYTEFIGAQLLEHLAYVR